MSLGADLTGELVPQVRKAADELIDKRQVVDFVVDFEKAGFIDSDGLETLLWLKRRCEDLFGQMKLANLDEQCRKILEITRLADRRNNHQKLLGEILIE